MSMHIDGNLAWTSVVNVTFSHTFGQIIRKATGVGHEGTLQVSESPVHLCLLFRCPVFQDEACASLFLLVFVARASRGPSFWGCLV